MYIDGTVIHRMKTSRRNFIRHSALATTGLFTAIAGNANATLPGWVPRVTPVINGANKISIFSKNLQWLNYEGMAATAKQIGFEGVDITVRPNGHVLPERAATDLPKAVEAVRKAGLDVFMITTAINDSTEAHTESIIKTAHELGIRYYRTNWFPYDTIASMPENIERIKARMQRLGELNRKYSISGCYQNHAGNSFGAAVWDLWEVFKDIDTEYLGCQYDVRHATVEGANSWESGFKVIHPFIKTYVIKDFQWSKKENGWKAETVPLGQGMVDFKKYFQLVKQYQINVPISMHFEYPLGGAEDGSKNISVPKETVIEAMRKDLGLLRKWLS
jgi:L-ribulose-5-phosphate 3-epimerase